VLSQYDSTFGQRIFWKWQSVFKASQEILSWTGQFNLLDWGCGTGIASRSFLECLGVEHVNSVYLFDKSEKALRFAQEKITSLFPKTKVKRWNGLNQEVDKTLPLVLLVSHVINELSSNDKAELLKLMKKAQVVIWVEPGTPQNSEILIQWREQMRSDFLFALPCTHQNTCGLFQSHSKNWCHFFAKPPAFIFQDAFWTLFSKKM
jgi:ribosomal protein RSM22 (predicted rRNA methylase)